MGTEISTRCARRHVAQTAENNSAELISEQMRKFCHAEIKADDKIICPESLTSQDCRSRKLSCTVIVLEIAMTDTMPINATSKITSKENFVFNFNPNPP